MLFGLMAGCGSSVSSDTIDEIASVVDDMNNTLNQLADDTAAAEETEATEVTADFSVAMITDYGDITDQSFNQTTYEACKEYCEANGIQFSYYKPAGDSTAERVAMVEKAVDEGYTVIVMPGYAFGETITQTAGEYPDVTFIALDVGEGDLGDYELPSNVYCAVYQEELCGYMAGYAAVKLGYTHLGFLGGMAVPAVIRYGYGYVQGADAAAADLGVDVTVEYVYGNQFYGDSDITAYMDNWYQTLGVQVVFACGGGIYSSAAEAAAKVDGAKVIGVDVDQAAIIDGDYGEGMTVTSAMKGLAPTVKHMLAEVAAGNFSNYGGNIETLGLVSGDDPTANYVQIPMDSTQWGDGFTQDDYTALVAAMYNGEITVSNDTSAMPEVSITVNDCGTIK
jgi:basic membrane protein A